MHSGRCGGTREARSTVTESLVELYRVSTHHAVWLVEDGVFRCEPLPSSNLVHFGRCGGTREARSTVTESLVELYRVSTHPIRQMRRAARSSTSQGSAEPLCARIKARTGRFLRGKLISDPGLFSSYESLQGAANGQDSWGFFRDIHRALDGWMLARAPASPAQGLHHHGPR